MITYRSRFLTRAEIWYDEEPGDLRSLDWVIYRQRSFPGPGANWRPFSNYFIDLTQDTEQLQRRLKEEAAYGIRRARERDHIVCETCDPSDRAVLDRFEEMYNPFAEKKGLCPLDRAHAESMVAADVLDLSVARDAQGNALVYHANYRDRHRATQLHSPSIYWKIPDSAARNRIGRANRYLIWCDLMRYKQAGLRCFDFGGWYPGTTDQGLLRINEFKRGFGGQIRCEYTCEQILSRKGWLVLAAAGVLKWAKLLPRGSSGPAPQPLPGKNQQPAALILGKGLSE